MLQATRARFNQYEVNPLCLLCHKEPENTDHFMLRCDALSGVRAPFVNRFISTLGEQCDGELVRELKSSDSKFVAVLLDCTVLEREIHEPILGTLLHDLESTSRGLCSVLHSKRTQLLNQRQ